MIKLPKYMQKDKVVVYPYKGQSGSGKDVFGSADFRRGNLEEKVVLIKTGEKAENVWQGKFKTEKPIPVQSKVYLENGVSQVSQCIPIKSFNGKVIFYEVFLE